MTVTLKHPVRRNFGCAAALACLLVGCGSEHEDGDAPSSRSIEIRTTEYGIPHIRANDYRSLGHGQGYAQARDNLCTIELGMLAFRGEVSRYFGPDAPPNSMTMTSPSSELSDFYYKGIVTSGAVESLVEKPAPLGPREEVRELVRGYVAGFNQRLAERPNVDCAHGEWVVPMTEMDVYRRVFVVTTLMDQTGIYAPGIVTAEPPIASKEAPLESSRRERLARWSDVIAPSSLPGSNGVALGGDITRSGGGINLANPHLDWAIDMRWAVNQLTIPGELDVSGASLIGVPLVVMGHTASVGFSITMAEPTRHHVVYELTLTGDSPTTYLVDGERREMAPRDVTIQVKLADGSIESRTRTEWWTEYGPVLGAGSIVPLPPWSASTSDGPGHAYAVSDVNTRNMRMLNTLFAFNHAKSSREILEAIRETQGVPWWSVLAADASGEALLSQIQVTPNVPDDMLEGCSTELGKAFFGALRIPVLDGARGDCAFRTDADALQDGTFGPGDEDEPRLPYVLTRDYAENSNDSYWLPSAGARIEGMPKIVGQEKTERSLRTRGLIAEIEEKKDFGMVTRETLADAMLSNRSYAADLVLDESVAICRALPGGMATSASGKRASVSAACDALAAFDHHMDSDSAGALLFSKYWVRAFKTAEAAEISLWKTPFDPADPVNTPNTLDPANPLLAQALADATRELEAAGIALDATLADHQYVYRNGERLPIGGGTDALAVMNLITSEPGKDPSNGSGYMHVVEFDGDACPDAVTLLTYSQSSEASSPHYADQTRLFSEKRWVTERFCEDAIQASPELDVLRLTPPAR